MPDHVHMQVSMPLKYLLSHIVEYLKGQMARYVAHKYAKQRRYTGHLFWARGYVVATTSCNEQVVSCYIRNQGMQDEAAGYANLFKPGY